MTHDTVISDESFTYDAAGNVTDAPDSCFAYDTNNRLVVFNGINVSYDMDGNMLSNGEMCFAYDSANRLISAGGHTYVYNAEDVRIRNLCESEDTTYTYDTNAKLSQLLCKTTNGVTTKYVYGKGLIGEETGDAFKTYHFDCRGSTIAMTDKCGNITDTFAYDTYGKLISRTGTSEVVFSYNGRDGVVTDANGLIYMRARYYSPDMKRFVNADIVAGKLSNAITLNRFAYANGNPVSFVDPFGLSVEYKGELDSKRIFELLNGIKSENDTKLASDLLAATLDVLLNFKNVIKVNSKVAVTFPLAPGTTITFSNKIESGDGNFEYSAVISDELEFANSFSFPMGDNGSLSVGSDGSVSIQYSANIDKYTRIEATISGNITEMSISARFTVTTTDKYDASFSTGIEFTHRFSNHLIQQPSAQPEGNYVPNDIPVDNTIPDHNKGNVQEDSSIGSNTSYGWDDFGRDVAGGLMMVGGIVVLAWALGNNVTGVGFADDLALIPLGAGLLGAVA